MIHLFTHRRMRRVTVVHLRRRPIGGYQDGGACGLVLNWRACWIGAHWGSHNRRLCVNLVPFLTLWITLPGGVEP